MAETYGVDIIPHSWGTGIAIHAAMHIIGNLDSNPGRMKNPIPLMELDRTENALRDILVQPCIIPNQQGLLEVPTKPGLGIEINQTALEKYQIK